MNVYKPDRWVIVELTTPKETLQKVFAGWYGGFSSGDSWKLNSGIVASRNYKDMFEFDGYSGSMYRCNRHNYGMSAYMEGIMRGWTYSLKEGYSIRILELDEVVVS